MRSSAGDHRSREQWRTNSAGEASRGGPRVTGGTRAAPGRGSAGATGVTASAIPCGAAGTGGSPRASASRAVSAMIAQQHAARTSLGGAAGARDPRCDGQQHRVRSAPSTVLRYSVAARTPAGARASRIRTMTAVRRTQGESVPAGRCRGNAARERRTRSTLAPRHRAPAARTSTVCLTPSRRSRAGSGRRARSSSPASPWRRACRPRRARRAPRTTWCAPGRSRRSTRS